MLLVDHAILTRFNLPSPGYEEILRIDLNGSRKGLNSLNAIASPVCCSNL